MNIRVIIRLKYELKIMNLNFIAMVHKLVRP